MAMSRSSRMPARGGTSCKRPRIFKDEVPRDEVCADEKKIAQRHPNLEDRVPAGDRVAVGDGARPRSPAPPSPREIGELQDGDECFPSRPPSRVLSRTEETAHPSWASAPSCGHHHAEGAGIRIARARRRSASAPRGVTLGIGDDDRPSQAHAEQRGVDRVGERRRLEDDEVVVTAASFTHAFSSPGAAPPSKFDRQRGGRRRHPDTKVGPPLVRASSATKTLMPCRCACSANPSVTTETESVAAAPAKTSTRVDRPSRARGCCRRGLRCRVVLRRTATPRAAEPAA